MQDKILEKMAENTKKEPLDIKLGIQHFKVGPTVPQQFVIDYRLLLIDTMEFEVTYLIYFLLNDKIDL